MKRRENGEKSLWEVELYTSLIVVGSVLILFSDPATSAMGVILAFFGAVDLRGADLTDSTRQVSPDHGPALPEWATLT